MLLGEYRGALTAADHLCVDDGAGQERVVGRPFLHPDAGARTVHAGAGCHRRGVRDGKHPVDHRVGSSERDLHGPCRVDSQKADVCPPSAHSLERLSRGTEQMSWTGIPNQDPSSWAMSTVTPLGAVADP